MCPNFETPKIINFTSRTYGNFIIFGCPSNLAFYGTLRNFALKNKLIGLILEGLYCSRKQTISHESSFPSQMAEKHELYPFTLNCINPQIPDMCNYFMCPNFLKF